MTALSADNYIVHKEKDILEFPVAASETIYKGALVMVVRGTGYAVSAADTANGIIVGVADKQADNSAGADGAINVRVKRVAIIPLTITSVGKADIGKIVYVSDDNTGSLTATTNLVICGKVVGYKTTNTAWVDIGMLWGFDGVDRRYYSLQVTIADLSTADEEGVVVPIAGTVTKVYTVIKNAITVADATVTAEIGGTAITGVSITIAYDGSAAWDVDSGTPTALNTVAAGDVLTAVTDGGSTTTCITRVTFLIKIS